MNISISPSDLFYRYRHKKQTRELPKFQGKPDAHPFDRDDLYEVLPMLEAVMNEIGSAEGQVLEKIEEMMLLQMPGFIRTREQVFDFLVDFARQRGMPS
ncbi:hypothetical protein [Pelovirga terrestris]|uniref:Uncharacterized protein n=1 Tax=Pelovirga terrestris TaxID=2771352 RepID=A0A8J6QNN7_9BACT|nr:hypothetical protein [Pelovirga terrestris]MBD1399716.1 hypothetical protein [Pelovirga terrestris]